MLPFRQKYTKEALPALMESFGYVNALAVPSVTKVSVNMGIGRIFRDEKLIEDAREILRRVTGQQPAVRKARVAIATFKTRVGSPVGLTVTLRGKRMENFLDRVTHVAFPRTRDFRGIPLSSVDAHGNLTVGVREHIIFPETTDLQTKQMYGMEITVTTNAKRHDAGVALYKELGFPMQTE